MIRKASENVKRSSLEYLPLSLSYRMSWNWGIHNYLAFIRVEFLIHLFSNWFFWFCISGFCVLIIYSQESTRRREGLLRKCIYARLYITTSGQKYRIINYKISYWRPLDTSHEVGGWKKTAKYNENCKKRTQKKMKIQKKKDEILFLVVI